MCVLSDSEVMKKSLTETEKSNRYCHTVKKLNTCCQISEESVDGDRSYVSTICEENVRTDKE